MSTLAGKISFELKILRAAHPVNGRSADQLLGEASALACAGLGGFRRPNVLKGSSIFDNRRNLERGIPV